MENRIKRVLNGYDPSTERLVFTQDLTEDLFRATMAHLGVLLEDELGLRYPINWISVTLIINKLGVEFPNPHLSFFLESYAT